FLMEAEKLSFVEAVETLGRQVGIEVTREEGGDSGEANRRREALGVLLDKVTGSFHHLLTRAEAGAAARKYLEDRGISGETLAAFQIGYAPADPFWLAGFLKKHGYSQEFLTSSGLLTTGRSGTPRAFFTHRVMFPIFSAKGDVVAFGGRILEQEGPKYLNSSESELFHKGGTLYGFFQAKEAIRKEKTAVIVEGYMDVVSLHQAGIKTAVAPLGTAFTPDQARLLRRFADTLILLFDADAAGQTALKRCAEICEPFEFTLFAAPLPEGKDPADFVQEKRPEELQKMIKHPILILDYFLQKYPERAAGTPAERHVEEFFPYIRSIVSAVRRDAALSRLAEVFAVEKAAVVADFQRKGAPRKKKEWEKETKKEALPLAMTPEFLLIIASVDNKEDFSYVRSRLSLDDFRQSESRDAFITLEDNFRNEEWNRTALLEKIEDPRIKDFIIQKLVSGELTQENKRKMIKDAIGEIEKRNFQARQKDVENQLARLDPGNESLIARLLDEKMYLDGELERLRGNRE
ncbi:MAG: DNA primase, partial [Spirochaetaceae bacterium]|nr:DNA primase [Spirochaetaceae bacterium]